MSMSQEQFLARLESDPDYRAHALRSGFVRALDYYRWVELQDVADAALKVREADRALGAVARAGRLRGFDRVEQYEEWLCLEALRLPARDQGDGRGEALDGFGDVAEVEGQVPVGVRVDAKSGLHRVAFGFVGKAFRFLIRHSGSPDRCGCGQRVRGAS